MIPGLGKPELGPVSSGLGEIYQYVLKPRARLRRQVHAIRTAHHPGLDRNAAADRHARCGRREQLRRRGEAVRERRGPRSAGQSMGVTIADVFDRLESNNENTGGAYIESGRIDATSSAPRACSPHGRHPQGGGEGLPDGVPVLMRRCGRSAAWALRPRYGAMTYNAKAKWPVRW
jgi:cobalt-zinc-cadmium resistance protein CzcA